MRIYIVGVSCVGKSTLGKLLADKYGYRFYDFDYVVMNHYGKTIEEIKSSIDSLFNEKKYRKMVSPLLKNILDNESDNLVIAMPPSGLFFEYQLVLRKHKDVFTMELKDSPDDIINRTVFYDKNMNPVKNVIHDNNRDVYLKDLKQSNAYYYQANRKAKLKVHLGGRSIEDALNLLDYEIQTWKKKQVCNCTIKF